MRGKKQENLQWRYIKITKNEMFNKDFGLRDQIQRSAVSIMSNIAEGFERMGNAEFHRFLVMAKACLIGYDSRVFSELSTRFSVYFKEIKL